MKKLSVILLAFILLYTGSISGQRSVFYDALFLKKIVDGDGHFGILNSRKILDYYYGIGLTDAQLSDSISKNPFLNLYYSSGSSASRPESLTIPGLASSVGSLDVTNVAEGLARFIVERTKQELNTYFFEEFAERIKNTIELQILFPQTSDMLSSIGSEIYNYNAYITGLRESFEVDLSNLIIRLPELIDYDRYKIVFDEFPDLRYILKSGLYLVNQMNSNVHPGDILHSYPDHFGIDPAPVNLFNAIKVTDLFSQSLRSTSGERYWIPQDSINLLYNETTFKIYLGLIFQIADTNIYFNVSGGKKIFFRASLSTLADSVNKYESWFNDFKYFLDGLATTLENTQLALKKIRESKTANPSAAEVYAFLNEVTGTIDFCRQISDLPFLKDSLDSGIFDLVGKLSDIADQGARLYVNLNDRKYGTAVINLLQLIDYGFDDILIYEAKRTIGYDDSLNKYLSIREQLKTPMNKKTSDKLKKELDRWHRVDSAVLGFQLNREIEEIGKFRNYVRKYGGFMAAVVNAGTSQDVQTAIESFALPAGSFRIKRESGFNVSLNSYLGLFTGHEFMNTIPDKPIQVNNVALSAPVGISFTKGAIKNRYPKHPAGAKGTAIGGFISLIDIGALASFRFKDTTSQVASRIMLKDILAPGIFFNWSIRNSPVTLLAGGQIGPMLREVTGNEFKKNDNYYIRYGVSVLVDIPILNLFNKP
ncbi:MAG: hypothetical protein V1903_14045 [Bacteroidota bacterium]